jgi:hypothetical protein
MYFENDQNRIKLYKNGIMEKWNIGILGILHKGQEVW